MRNVMTWNEALNERYEPRLYPYAAESIPSGSYQVRVDFKIWSKNVMGINCYFSEVTTGNKFQLTVYRRRKDKIYALENSTLDMAESPLNQLYNITCEHRNGQACLTGIELVG